MSPKLLFAGLLLLAIMALGVTLMAAYQVTQSMSTGKETELNSAIIPLPTASGQQSQESQAGQQEDEEFEDEQRRYID
jgi:hypothetical protein